MANTSAIWQQAAHTAYQLSSPSCSTRAIQKSLTLNEKNIWEFSGKKVRKMDHYSLAEKCQDRKSKRTRQGKKQEIGKGNQMTALRFKTGGRHRHPQPLFGGCKLWLYNEVDVINILLFFALSKLHFGKKTYTSLLKIQQGQISTVNWVDYWKRKNDERR